MHTPQVVHLVAALLISAACHGATTSFNITLLSAPAGSGLTVGDTFSGTVCYDPSDLVGIGSETLEPSFGITLTVSFRGETYTESDDTSFGTFPQVFFEDGEILGLSFEAIMKNPDADPLNSYLLIEGTGDFYYSIDGFDEDQGIVTLIPEPSSSLLLLAGGCGLLLRRRRG